MPEPVEHGRGNSPGTDAAELFEPLRVALLGVPEAERYRLVCAFFADLAQGPGPRAVGAGADHERLEALSKKVQRLGEEKALADDALAAAKADLEHRAKQLDAEQQRSKELERIAGDQRTRLQAAQTQVGELEQQVTAKTAQLYEAENQVEALRLKLQRADLAGRDTTRVDTLEDARRGLGVQLEQARAELERVRTEKDAAIEQLKTELGTSRGASGAGGDAVLAGLWDRLALAKPPLAPGGCHPSVKAAERLVDALVELARFVHDFDQSIRPFLNSFTRYNPTLARPWDVYARSPGLEETVREVIDAERGKPAGVLKMRLLGLKRWTLAALIGCDTTLESIAGELEQHLRGQVGMEADPNRRVKDYLRDDGNQLFHEHMRGLRGQKLADVYAHGG